MSVEAAVAQYRQAFVDQFETRVTGFRAASTKEAMSSGLTVTFLVAGSGTDTAVTRGVNGQIPYGNPTNSQITATLVEKHAPYELTGFNIFASQGDQKAIMRKNSMAVINRDIELTCLAELANATIDTGTTAVASLAMVENAKAYLGNQSVPVEEEDNMFACVTPSFMSNLRRMTEFASHDYVDVKVFNGPTRKMLRWNGVQWFTSSLISGISTATELCYMWHRDAIGYAVNVGEDKIALGYDEQQDKSWTRATIYHAAKILQNTGIVQLKHDGSASALS
jgi:Phage capsid protein